MQKVNKFVVCNQKEVIGTFESETNLYVEFTSKYTAILIKIKDEWQFWTFHQNGNLMFECIETVSQAQADMYLRFGVTHNYAHSSDS